MLRLSLPRKTTTWSGYVYPTRIPHMKALPPASLIHAIQIPLALCYSDPRSSCFARSLTCPEPSSKPHPARHAKRSYTTYRPGGSSQLLDHTLHGRRRMTTRRKILSDTENRMRQYLEKLRPQMQVLLLKSVYVATEEPVESAMWS